MFGLTPFPIYAIVFLLFTNILAVFAWQMQSHEADYQKQRAETCAAQHQAFVDQTRAEGERMVRRAAETIAKNEIVTQRVKRENQANFDRMRSDYKRLRQQYAAANSGSGEVPAIPEAPRRIDAIPADCLPLAEQSAETTLMLTSLQDWIQQQAEVGNGQ